MGVLNNKEVQEIAKMQQLIDKYELAIRSLFLFAKCGQDINYPQFATSEHDEELAYLYKWIKARRNEDKDETDEN